MHGLDQFQVASLELVERVVLRYAAAASARKGRPMKTPKMMPMSILKPNVAPGGSEPACCRA